MILLLGCDPDAGTRSEAQYEAELLLEARGLPTVAVARVGVDDTGRQAVVWGVPFWGAIDLDAWLAPCAVPAETQVQATLYVGPGTFPWKVDELRVEPSDTADNARHRACVESRLARLPLDEPSVVGREDLYLVRWTPPPRPQMPSGAVTRVPGRRTADPALVPPYYRYATNRRGILGDTLRFEHGLVRYRGSLPTYADHVAAEAPAALLACRGEAGTLVRTLLWFVDGELVDVQTEPDTPCVERRAREGVEELLRLEIGDHLRVEDVAELIYVLDVPGGGA